MQKEWARDRKQKTEELCELYERVMRSQRKALVELRLISEELYQAAIQPDEALLPISITGPVSTPPNKNYMSPAEYHSNIRLHFRPKGLSFRFHLFFRMVTTMTLAKSGSKIVVDVKNAVVIF